MTLQGVYGMSVITALTAQNTTGVFGIHEVPPEFVRQQLEAVFSDIPPDAVKIGMVASAPLMETIARCLRDYHAPQVVVDPVMVSTSGARLMAGGSGDLAAGTPAPGGVGDPQRPGGGDIGRNARPQPRGYGGCGEEDL